MATTINNPLAVYIEGVDNGGPYTYTATRNGRIADLFVRCTATNAVAANTVSVTTVGGMAASIVTAAGPVVGTVERLGVSTGADNKPEGNAKFGLATTLVFASNNDSVFSCTAVLMPAVD